MPGGVIVPGLPAQAPASRTCSGVRELERLRTSVSAALKASDPNAGGGPGRNWLADVRNQGVTPGICPPITGVVGVTLVQYPGPVGGAGFANVLNPSPCPRVTIAAPTSRPIASPRPNQGWGCPGPALAWVVTKSSNARAPPGKT